MDILLDTHAAIWFFADDKRLSKPVIAAIYDMENMIYVSISSLWELAIKLHTGKLEFAGGLDGFMDAIYANDFFLLGVDPGHVRATMELPAIHRDPFDRMLIAQALVEDMVIVTADASIMAYDVRFVW